MPRFHIGFTAEKFIKAEPNEEGLVGLLVLGQHEERFPVHFYAWSMAQYVDQWNKALVRSLTGMPSALITDMATPAQSSHLIWWPMWRLDDEMVFQNQLFFFDQHGSVKQDFVIEDLFGFIGKHKAHDEDGNQLSEWVVPVSDIEFFLDKRMKL